MLGNHKRLDNTSQQKNQKKYRAHPNMLFFRIKILKINKDVNFILTI